MRVECEVIQDLLPLYVEDLASEKSRELVEEHLRTCENCRIDVEKMQQENPQVKYAQEVDPWKKIRRKIRRDKITVGVIVAFLVVAVMIVLQGKFFLVPGDEMGYSLLNFYICLPLTALICSIIAGIQETKIKWGIPALFGLTGWLLPWIVFETTDVIFVMFALVPACIGLVIGIICKFVLKVHKRRRQ